MTRDFPQQLAAFQRGKAKPAIQEADRVILSAFSRLHDNWKETILAVRPETVIRWHRNLFKQFWTFKSRPKSRPRGRPQTSKETIDAIRQMSRLNPTWSAERIARELRVKLGIVVCEATVAKYMIRLPKPPSKEWRAFLDNHNHEIWAMDFLVQHTATFDLVYILTIKHHATRKVVHIAATANPCLDWVKQQVRQALWDEDKPAFLIHDNDGIFGNYGVPLGSGGRKYRCHLDRWLFETMGIRGIPTPYHSPMANAIVERYHGTLRRECLDHFIFLNVDHVQHAISRFQIYFNAHRTHSGIDGIPAPLPDSGYVTEKPVNGKLLAIPRMGGLVYDFRWAA